MLKNHLSFSLWGPLLNVLKQKIVPLTSHTDRATESHQCNVVVVLPRVVVLVQDDPVHVGSSHCAYVSLAWHHSPAAHFLFAAARPEVDDESESGKSDFLLDSRIRAKYTMKWLVIKRAHPVKQWAAVTTQRGDTSEPPHTWWPPCCRLTCQGQSSMKASVPPTIRSCEPTSPQSEKNPLKSVYKYMSTSHTLIFMSHLFFFFEN